MAPNLVHVLNYPENHEAWFDIVMNELDGDWHEERNPITLAPDIDIPVWLQIDQGRGDKAIMRHSICSRRRRSLRPIRLPIRFRWPCNQARVMPRR